MVLSGVARTEARFPCGKNLIAQMLCGSGNAKMSKLRLDKLSTFGLLKHLRQPEVTLMIEALDCLALPGAGRSGAVPARGATDGVRPGGDERQRDARRCAAVAARTAAEIEGRAEGGREKREGGRKKAEGRKWDNGTAR